MNIKTNLLEDYILFIDTTTKQNTYFRVFKILIAFITTLFLFFLSFKYLIE